MLSGYRESWCLTTKSGSYWTISIRNAHKLCNVMIIDWKRRRWALSGLWLRNCLVAVFSQWSCCCVVQIHRDLSLPLVRVVFLSDIQINSQHKDLIIHSFFFSHRLSIYINILMWKHQISTQSEKVKVIWLTKWLKSLSKSSTKHWFSLCPGAGLLCHRSVGALCAAPSRGVRRRHCAGQLPEVWGSSLLWWSARCLLCC